MIIRISSEIIAGTNLESRLKSGYFLKRYAVKDKNVFLGEGAYTTPAQMILLHSPHNLISYGPAYLRYLTVISSAKRLQQVQRAERISMSLFMGEYVRIAKLLYIF